MLIYRKKKFEVLKIMFLAILFVLILITTVLAAFFVMPESFGAGVFILASQLILLIALAHMIKNHAVFIDENTPILEVTEKGVFDRRIMVKTVPWENLSWRRYSNKGNLSICIDIHENKYDYVKKQMFLDKFATGVANLLRMPEFTITLEGLQTPPRDIIAEFQNHKPQR